MCAGEKAGKKRTGGRDDGWVGRLSLSLPGPPFFCRRGRPEENGGEQCRSKGVLMNLMGVSSEEC